MNGHVADGKSYSYSAYFFGGELFVPFETVKMIPILCNWKRLMYVCCISYFMLRWLIENAAPTIHLFKDYGWLWRSVDGWELVYLFWVFS